MYLSIRISLLIYLHQRNNFLVLSNHDIYNPKKSISKAMYICTVFPWINVILSCFKQLPLFLLLLDVAGGLMSSSHNLLDFHDKIWSVLLIFLKYLYIGWTLNNFEYHHLQNGIYLENNLNQILWSLLFYLILLLILLLLLMLLLFLIGIVHKFSNRKFINKLLLFYFCIRYLTWKCVVISRSKILRFNVWHFRVIICFFY